MKELQAKAKVTQTMTRDGLVVENQADGTVENVSSREAEQDYSTDAEGKAEKILERAEDIKDEHKNKKKAKKAAETAATAKSEDGLHRSAARLELTEDERADPELQPYIHKAEAKADKLDAARAALPKKRVPVKEKVYDAASGKAKSTLRFEQQDKGPPSLKPNPASRPLSEALLFAHGKIHEVEHENVGVEGGHKGEELVERQTAKAIRSGIRHHKMKPYKAVEKAERQLMSANIDHPADFKGHSLSVSDVVVLHQNGQDTAHYCDSVGFQQVPEFLRENPLRTAELSTEQNENMIDGVLNNAPSLGELEAKAKAGEQISLTDLAAAVKAEEKAPKAKKSRAAKPKKPSIRAQLDAAKKEQSKQSPPREKTKELEV